MTDTPVKPTTSGSAEARVWNLYVAERIAAAVQLIRADMAELTELSKEFVSGGSTVEWEVAWSNIRFAERTLRAWQLNEEVSRRESEARFAPPPSPAPVLVPLESDHPTPEEPT